MQEVRPTNKWPTRIQSNTTRAYFDSKHSFSCTPHV